jgi:hypothetical protein
MAEPGGATVNFRPQPLSVTTLVSPCVVSVSVTGRTLRASVSVSRALIVVSEPLAVVFRDVQGTSCSTVAPTASYVVVARWSRLSSVAWCSAAVKAIRAS